MRLDLWHRRDLSSKRRRLAGDSTASSIDYRSLPSSRQRSDPRLLRPPPSPRRPARPPVDPRTPPPPTAPSPTTAQRTTHLH
jgi:hypothetical protein